MQMIFKAVPIPVPFYEERAGIRNRKGLVMLVRFLGEETT